MARYNEILTGRHNRSLQKLFSMKGGPPAPQLSTEIGVTHSLMSAMENRYLEAWSLFWGFFAIGPSVGNNNGIQFRNPAGSNVIAIIEQLRLGDSGNQTFTLSVILTPQVELTNGGVSVARDFRIGGIGTGSSLILSSFSPVAAFATAVQQYGLTANVEQETITLEDQQIPILPGETMRITTGVVNSTSRINFKWRERFLEDSERT